MGYSKFMTLKQVTQTFGLQAKRKTLFSNKIKKVLPSDWLLASLSKARLFPLNNEKNKSERVVSPILLEVAEFYKENLTLFSGEKLDIDSNQNLAGLCDFFFTILPNSPYLEAPIISLTEAKGEDMEYGIGQCSAQLYGAKLFNESEGKNIPILYGCATDSVEWQFLCFENNTFYVDTEVYTNLEEILGIWHYIINLYL